MNKPYLYIARVWASRYHGHVTSPTSEHVSVRHVTRVFPTFGGKGPRFAGITRCLTAGGLMAQGCGPIGPHTPQGGMTKLTKIKYGNSLE